MAKLGFAFLLGTTVCAAGVAQAATVSSGGSNAIGLPASSLFAPLDVDRGHARGGEAINFMTDRPISNHEHRETREVSPVPLPASMPLLLAGLAGLGLVRRRARR